jgi:hypothetical protein
VDREAVIILGILNACCFALLELLRPVHNDLLELGTSQVAEGCVLAERSCLPVYRFFEAIAKSFTKVGELGLVGKRANRSHDLFPILQISVVDNVPKILANDRGQ